MKRERDQRAEDKSNKMMAKLKKLDGEVLSIFKVVESHPSQFKTIVDRLL